MWFAGSAHLFHGELFPRRRDRLLTEHDLQLALTRVDRGPKDTDD
jgi:hypothetical protein